MTNQTQTDRLAEVLDCDREALDERATLMAAGFDDWAAYCALRTENDGGFCHAYFYSDGFWRFQTGGGDLHQSDGKVLRCVLTKRLYAVPQSLSTDLAKAEKQLKAVLDREAETHARHDRKVDALQQRVEQLEGENAEMVVAIAEVFEQLMTTYRAKNGRHCSIEDDNGELCYIVPSDAIDNLRQDGSAPPPEARAGGCTVAPHGWKCSRDAGHEGPCAAALTGKESA